VKEFEKTLANLNKDQREAVEQIDGPVLVIAGPGTGKTQLLSSRVAHILTTTDTRPENILCLTYTNKAAINMKSRIIEQVGAAGAKVAASTFHSFAAEVMNLYPDYFWNAARLSVAPDAVQLDVIESIVRELPLDNPLALKFAGQYTLLSAIKNSIKLAKDAGLTPDKLKALLEVNVAYIDEVEPRLVEILAQRLSAKNLGTFRDEVSRLPQQGIDEAVYPLISLSSVITSSLDEALALDEDSGKTTNTSKWKARWVQTVGGQKLMSKERDRNIWWLGLAGVYAKYRELLHQRGFYDYADMLVEVISQLEQNPEILADIQERFSYVLIDEFQDTTPAQLRLAHLVADHHTAEGKPNLMVVGDDDQSIYKFNGAELNNMLNFKRNYPTAKIIILHDNYRSTQAILDLSKKIIDQADSRLVKSDPSLNKDLIAKRPPSKGAIRALAYASQELQLSEIARDIKAHHKPGYEIAVLARGHDSLVKMAGILQALKVPVRYEQSSNSLDHELINQIYLVSKLLLAIQNGSTERVDALIHEVIRWPAWGLSPKQLWELALNSKANWLDRLLNSPAADIKGLGDWLLWLAKESANQPLAVTIEQIIGLRESAGYTSPIKDYFTHSAHKDTNSYFHGLSAVQLVRALVHEFSASDEPKLSEFARFIEINKENGIVVADESPFITGSHAVALLSVHKAKGLEFDHVYVIDAIEDNWRPRSSNRKPPSNLPLQPAGDDFDDYVRLLYVAATRAKSSLTISAYYQDHSGKDISVSTIVQGAIEPELVDQTDQAKLIEVLEENLRWPDLSGGAEKQMLKAKLEEYNLYATHLLNFLDVTRGGPQYFKERNLLYLPELKTASMAYGTAMHAALEAAQKLANSGKFALPDIQRQFGQALKAEQLMKTDYERYLELGKDTLKKLFKDFGYHLQPGSLSEQKMKDVMVGKARLGGTVDRIDRNGNQITILDYKTGSPLSNFYTRGKTKAIRVYKHKLQLVFYTLLVNQHMGTNVGDMEGQMIYLQSETLKGLTLAYKPTQQDMDHLRSLIAAVWERIMAVDLPDTSGYPKDIDGILQFEADLLK